MWGWPEITLFAIQGFLLVAVIFHQVRNGEAGAVLLNVMVAVISVWLLWMGGFWS